jgi:hypothetical protein
MVDAKREELEVGELPKVCPLCWGWILKGEATEKTVDGEVHRTCWRSGEAE